MWCIRPLARNPQNDNRDYQKHVKIHRRIPRDRHVEQREKTNSQTDDKKTETEEEDQVTMLLSLELNSIMISKVCVSLPPCRHEQNSGLVTRHLIVALISTHSTRWTSGMAPTSRAGDTGVAHLLSPGRVVTSFISYLTVNANSLGRV